MRQLNELDRVERRVIGVLLEKEMTTPEYYPLTTKALVSGCNQSTNRDPVMTLREHDILQVLEGLESEGLLERESGPRADRWKHFLIQPQYRLPAHKAVLTLLLLRGPQTPGELRSRGQRMHPFEDLPEVESVLQALQVHGLVRELNRKPGQKEARWSLQLPPEELAEAEELSPAPPEAELEARVARLEEKVEQILRRLESSRPEPPGD